jgi:hypothetical protein
MFNSPSVVCHLRCVYALERARSVYAVADAESSDVGSGGVFGVEMPFIQSE